MPLGSSAFRWRHHQEHQYLARSSGHDAPRVDKGRLAVLEIIHGKGTSPSNGGVPSLRSRQRQVAYLSISERMGAYRAISFECCSALPHPGGVLAFLLTFRPPPFFVRICGLGPCHPTRQIPFPIQGHSNAWDPLLSRRFFRRRTNRQTRTTEAHLKRWKRVLQLDSTSIRPLEIRRRPGR